MIVVRAVVMGPNQPSGKKLKRKRIVPPRRHVSPQTIYQSFWCLVTGKIKEKELRPVRIGRKQLCF